MVSFSGAVGSDSQVVRAWPEELRWLEWGQRLLHRGRNVAAAPGVEPASAARLFERVRAGGGTAAGFARWGLEVGARADPSRLSSVSIWTVIRRRSPPVMVLPGTFDR